MHARFVAIALAACLLVPISSHAVPVTLLPDSPAPARASNADGAFRKGLEALVRNDLTAADREFTEALRLDAKFAPALLGRAEVASRKNETAAVANFLMQAAQISPRDAYVQASLGRYYGVQKDYAKSEAALIAAMQIDPMLISARMDLADIYTTALNKPDQAIALYRQAIVQKPDHAGAHYALGIALADKDAAESARLLAKSAQLDKANPLPAIALARLNLKQNKADQALQWADTALRLDPSSIGAALLRTDALFAQNKSAEALGELEKLAAKQPKNADVQFRLATGLHTTGKLSEATVAYRRVTQLAPRNAVAWNNLSALLIDAKSAPAESVTSAQKAVEVSPDDAQFRDTLGWAHWNAGSKDAALKELSAANKLAPNDAGIWYHLGIAYAETNRKPEAVAALNRALQIDSKFFGAQDAKKRLASLK